MKRLSVLMGITQGILVLAGSALAGEGSNSLFALNKISASEGARVLGLSDAELARVEGSTVARFSRTVESQSNVAQQHNSATGSRGEVSQENRLTQTNGGTSGSHQSIESHIMAIQTAVQKAIRQTLPWFSMTTALGNSPATVTLGNQGIQTSITMTNQGKTITVVGPQIPEQAVSNSHSVESHVPIVPRIDAPRGEQAANIPIPLPHSNFNIGGQTSVIGQGFGGAVRF